MWEDAGIVRSTERLKRAEQHLTDLSAQIERDYNRLALTPALIELRNLATVAGLIVRCAQARQESRGLHYTVDHPYRDNEHGLRDTVVLNIGVRFRMECSAKPELVKASEADNEENPFEAMMSRFDRAAELLDLEPGLYKVLRHPEKQIIVVGARDDGQRRDRGVHRLPRAVQHVARTGQGRHPLRHAGHARRGDGARGVDDLEVRRRERAVRRRQGRRDLRPVPMSASESSSASRGATRRASSTCSAPNPTCPRRT